MKRVVGGSSSPHALRGVGRARLYSGLALQTNVSRSGKLLIAVTISQLRSQVRWTSPQCRPGQEAVSPGFLISYSTGGSKLAPVLSTLLSVFCPFPASLLDDHVEGTRITRVRRHPHAKISSWKSPLPAVLFAIACDLLHLHVENISSTISPSQRQHTLFHINWNCSQVTSSHHLSKAPQSSPKTTPNRSSI